MIPGNMCYPIGEMVDLFEQRVKYNDGLRYSTFALTMVSCIVGLTGNAIVIFITALVMKKKSKIWFLNLAIADFISFLVIPLHGFAILSGVWSYGLHMCKTFLFVLCISGYANIFILIALNISRVLSVAKPIFHQTFINQRVSWWTCAVIWMITLLSSLPMLYFGRTFKIGDSTYCNFMSSMDFDNGPFDPLYNLTSELPDLQEKAYLDSYEKYYQFFMTCSSEKCCCNEDIIAKWDDLVFSIKCLIIPFLIISYFLPLSVILFANITIVIQVHKSQILNPQRLYRVVITIIMVYFVTWTPATLAQVIFLHAIKNRNLVMMFKVEIFMPFLGSIAYTNSCMNPIMYVLVGRQARTSFADYLSSLKARTHARWRSPSGDQAPDPSGNINGPRLYRHVVSLQANKAFCCNVGGRKAKGAAQM